MPSQNNARGYCSPACEIKDASPSKLMTDPVSIMSPLPPIFALPVPSEEHLTNNTSSRLHRPSLGVIHPPPASISPHSSQPPVNAFRSRRAYSEAIVVSGQSRAKTLPSFARKSNSVVVVAKTVTSPILMGRSRLSISRIAKTTGNNTPNVPESAICSTSESSEPEAAETASHSLVNKSLHLDTPLQTTFRPTHRISPSADHALGIASRSTSHISQMPTNRSPSGHRQLQSPVAAMFAVSSSSRSREDIMSWAAAVRERPPGDDSELEDERRSRRSKPLPLPGNETGRSDDGDDPACTGTTPRGRSTITSALTFSSMVKAIKGVTSYTVPNPPDAPAPSGLGLHSVPALSQPEISRIAVVVGPSQVVDNDQHHRPQSNGGATPTLSSVSFSEFVDPSVATDNAEQMDVIADDVSEPISFRHSSTSQVARRSSVNLNKPISGPTSDQPSAIQSSKARAPIGTTLWNSISFLRSFAPFALPNNSRPVLPVLSRESTSTVSPIKQSPEIWRSTPLPALAKMEITPPMKDSLDRETGYLEDEEEEEISSPLEIVRSLPMNILTMGGRSSRGEEDLDAGERKRERIEVSRSPSLVVHGGISDEAEETNKMVVKTYDASDEDGDDEAGDGDEGCRGRGRGRRRKSKLAAVEMKPASPKRIGVVGGGVGARDDSTDERGRRRDRVAESRERDFSAVRGRSSNRTRERRGS